MKQAVSFANDGGRPGSPTTARRWRTPRLFGVALTPANVIGAALALFFTSQVFITAPFQPLTLPSPSGSSDLGDSGFGATAVRRDSHAYLAAAYPGAPKDFFTANASRWYDPKNELERQKLSEEASFYARWIEEDLSPWKEGGITRDLVESAAMLYDTCDGDMLRFQVLNGSLWVQTVTDRRGGWYPAVHGPGNLAAKGRVPYALLSLLDVLRTFPGQVPDLDAVLHTADFACVKREWAGTPLPLFGYQASAGHRDLAWPDFTFWGHEHQFLQDPWGGYVYGWPAQADLLRRKYGNVSLAGRVPQAMWRGRTHDALYPERDRLRRRFVACPRELQRAGRPQDAALFSVSQPPVALQDACDFRFNVYLESEAWVSNLKQKIVCGSVLVAPRLQYWEWWTRALVPGEHYVEVSGEEAGICDEVAAAVGGMNAALASPAGRAAVPPTGTTTPSLAKRLQEAQRNPHLARLLGSSGSGDAAELPVKGAKEGGSHAWGSAAQPWQIAAAGQAFVREHVRMQDALLYMRDSLRAYAALQRFKPRPAPKSACVRGGLLLQEHFGVPYEGDAAAVAQAYPWLNSHDGGCTQAEAVWGTF